MITNKVSATLEDATARSVLDTLKQVETQLPFLINLSEEEKRRMVRIGDGVMPFLVKCLEIAKQNDDFLPRAFDVSEMEKDVNLYRQLIPVYQAMQLLCVKMEDTISELRSEAYASALVIYGSAKNSRIGTAGLGDLVDDLATRFARRSSAKTKQSNNNQ